MWTVPAASETLAQKMVASDPREKKPVQWSCGEHTSHQVESCDQSSSIYLVDWCSSDDILFSSDELRASVLELLPAKRVELRLFAYIHFSKRKMNRLTES
ncbi:hypothetical protein CSKR_203586 [Clonorchis sinensis]|uniref:Uncharacterized protein n=1 Tax=Clonorchis sinensis TaxID=79923 RepID=A0A8T1MCM6_CLOSI|nr:hypothetical protein CSKR_203586 [Clonorchis sinensis]